MSMCVSVSVCELCVFGVRGGLRGMGWTVGWYLWLLLLWGCVWVVCYCGGERRGDWNGRLVLFVCVCELCV